MIQRSKGKRSISFWSAGMLKMDEYEYIRIARFKFGHTIRKISRDTKKSRPVIRKAIEGKEPKYNLSKPKNRPVMDKHRETITKWLIEDKKVKKKQRHTATRIYKRLVEEHDFKGGKSTVVDFVRDLKEELNLIHKEVFIPSDPKKRNGCEMDWGTATIELNGIKVESKMFCMRAKYSGKIFVKLYPVEVQECFFNGHIEGFIYFGGVFKKIIYDNLKTVVQKVLKGRDRIEQGAFISFRSYYCFEAIFCNTNSGNEKGGIEGLVGFARRNFLTPILKGESFEEINDHLIGKCEERDLDRTHGQTLLIGELFEHEKSDLMALPSKQYNNYKLILNVKIDKYSTVTTKNNRYSVPCNYSSRKVSIELGLDDVRIIYKNKVIAVHKRSFQKQQWVLNPWHYLEVLQYKTRAFEESMISMKIKESWDPAVYKLWETQVSHHGECRGTKDFLESLLFFQDKPYQEMVTVIQWAIESKTTNTESVKMLYEMLNEKLSPIEEVEVRHIETISHFTLPSANIEKFNSLLEEIKYG